MKHKISSGELHTMRLTYFILLGLCAITLGGCQTLNGLAEDLGSLELPSLTTPTAPQTQKLIVDNKCPKAELVNELSSLTNFVTPTDPQYYNMVSYAELTSIDTQCSLNTRSVTIDLDINFMAEKGPQSLSISGTHPYFIAVTSPDGDILAKEIFNVNIPYTTDVNGVSTKTESTRQIIPLQDPEMATEYKILVGFQLSQEQLAYNMDMIKRRAQEEAAAEMAAQQEEQNTAQPKNMSSAPISKSGAPQSMAEKKAEPLKPVSDKVVIIRRPDLAPPSYEPEAGSSSPAGSLMSVPSAMPTAAPSEAVRAAPLPAQEMQDIDRDEPLSLIAPPPPTDE